MISEQYVNEYILCHQTFIEHILERNPEFRKVKAAVSALMSSLHIVTVM